MTSQWTPRMIKMACFQSNNEKIALNALNTFKAKLGLYDPNKLKKRCPSSCGLPSQTLEMAIKQTLRGLKGHYYLNRIHYFLIVEEVNLSRLWESPHFQGQPIYLSISWHATIMCMPNAHYIMNVVHLKKQSYLNCIGKVLNFILRPRQENDWIAEDAIACTAFF
jgi:hypothetical protein